MEKRLKKSIICKNAAHYGIDRTLVNTHLPQVGDVAVFEVISIGKHTTVQGEDKRLCNIYAGDYIMAAFGTRYATEQFEGYMPEKIESEYHILGAGGTVGIIKSMHAKFRNGGPTRLKMIGYATDKNGGIINTKKLHADKMLSFRGVMQSLTRVVLSIGSSMDSGKTTTAAHLVRGLKNKGMRVGFIKLTGTIYTKDTDLAYDNGADAVANFGDMGFPSTFMCEESELLNLHETLLSNINAEHLDYVVVEIADGIYQRETEMLLGNSRFMAGVDSVIFSACDSLSAVQGVQALQQMHIIPVALCGLFTAAPLLIKEVKAKVHIPVLTIEQMANGECLRILEEPLNMVA